MNASSSLDKIPTAYMSALVFVYITASVLNRFDITEIPGSDIYQYQSYEDNFLNICSLSLQFGLAKMIKIIYNDNRKKVAKFQN